MSIHTKKVGNLTVTVDYDVDPRNPRSDDDELVGTMICSHKRYLLGDEQVDWEAHDDWPSLYDHLIAERGAVAVLPLNLYDHSGISMTVGRQSGWDCGPVGFIYATDLAVADVESQLRDEVQIYDRYLQGQVYQYTVTDEFDEAVESCGGFYGSEDALVEGISMAQGYVPPLGLLRGREAELEGKLKNIRDQIKGIQQ